MGYVYSRAMTILRILLLGAVVLALPGLPGASAA
jgi:hypothetical protein